MVAVSPYHILERSYVERPSCRQTDRPSLLLLSSPCQSTSLPWPWLKTWPTSSTATVAYRLTQKTPSSSGQTKVHTSHLTHSSLPHSLLSTPLTLLYPTHSSLPHSPFCTGILLSAVYCRVDPLSRATYCCFFMKDDSVVL